jgi:hypothetical protein
LEAAIPNYNYEARKKAAALREEGIKTRLLKLPSGYEMPLQEIEKGRWVSISSISKAQHRAMLGKDWSKWDLPKHLNALPSRYKGRLRFRLLFDDEMQDYPCEKKGLSRDLAGEQRFIAETPEMAKISSCRVPVKDAEMIHKQMRENWNYHKHHQEILVAQGKTREEISKAGYGDSQGEFEEKFLKGRNVIRLEGKWYWEKRLEEMGLLKKEAK